MPTKLCPIKEEENEGIELVASNASSDESQHGPLFRYLILHIAMVNADWLQRTFTQDGIRFSYEGEHHDDNGIAYSTYSLNLDSCNELVRPVYEAFKHDRFATLQVIKDGSFSNYMKAFDQIIYEASCRASSPHPGSSVKVGPSYHELYDIEKTYRRTVLNLRKALSMRETAPSSISGREQESVDLNQVIVYLDELKEVLFQVI